MFSVTSFNLSIASETVVEPVKVVTLPGLLKLPSPPDPSVILYAFVLILATLASYCALVTASVAIVALAILTLDRVEPSAAVTCNMFVVAFATNLGPLFPN